MDEHPFAVFIRTLGRGKRGRRDLDRDAARRAMGMILDDQVRPEQLGAFLMLLRVKEESPDEVAGMVEAVRARLPASPTPPRTALDWPSYAGKRRHPPWFVLAQCLLAASGRAVLVHGRVSADPQRCATQTVYQALGLPLAHDLEEATQWLQRRGLCYLPLARLSPALDALFDLRSLLGLRSPVNTVARMINPLGLPSLQGIFHPAYAPLHQRAAALLGDAVISFRGEGGEGEVRPDTDTRLYVHLRGCREAEWPALLDHRPVRPETWQLEDLCALWHGHRQDPYGEAAVVSSTALALHLLHPERPREAVLEEARDLWAARDRAYLPERPLS